MPTWLCKLGLISRLKQSERKEDVYKHLWHLWFVNILPSCHFAIYLKKYIYPGRPNLQNSSCAQRNPGYFRKRQKTWGLTRISRVWFLDPCKTRTLPVLNPYFTRTFPMGKKYTGFRRKTSVIFVHPRNFAGLEAYTNYLAKFWPQRSHLSPKHCGCALDGIQDEPSNGKTIWQVLVKLSRAAVGPGTLQVDIYFEFILYIIATICFMNLYDILFPSVQPSWTKTDHGQFRNSNSKIVSVCSWYLNLAHASLEVKARKISCAASCQAWHLPRVILNLLDASEDCGETRRTNRPSIQLFFSRCWFGDDLKRTSKVHVTVCKQNGLEDNESLVHLILLQLRT